MTSTDDFLSHHGIKGMRWGVRRSQEELGYAKTKATEGVIKRHSAKKNLRNDRIYTTAKNIARKGAISEKQYNNMSTQSETLDSGTTLRRLSRAPDFKDAVKGNAFVSNLKSDQTRYRAILPTIGDTPTRKGGRKEYKSDTYEFEMKTIKKLTGPSEKERVDIFIDLIDRKRVQVNGKVYTGRELLSTMGYKGDIDKLSSQELGLKTYMKFHSQAGDWNQPINTAYFNAAKRRGYGFMTDDNDRGVYSSAPKILLGPTNKVKVTSVKQLTADDINRAQREMERVRS